jgi:hypothetical protein
MRQEISFKNTSNALGIEEVEERLKLRGRHSGYGDGAVIAVSICAARGRRTHKHPAEHLRFLAQKVAVNLEELVSYLGCPTIR